MVDELFIYLGNQKFNLLRAIMIPQSTVLFLGQEEHANTELKQKYAKQMQDYIDKKQVEAVLKDTQNENCTGTDNPADHLIYSWYFPISATIFGILVAWPKMVKS
ncbi:hypothetical protein TNCT_622881 [Trichonephila clavata]|uniref:Uncharacterized protein n=1 Tax=Trichonephila clavata TaxID=2740835 RepID=A0A8X6KTV3_TRICU|nr:hypothetical protein TNCT_622881 [Trichonephila clavata]